MPARDHDHDNLGGSNRVLTAAEAAELLRLETKDLKRYWKQWGIPGYRVGREVRFIERELRAWLKKQQVPA